VCNFLKKIIICLESLFAIIKKIIYYVCKDVFFFLHLHLTNAILLIFIGVSVGASVFTIAAMSIDRYLAIEHSMSFRKVLNRKSTIYVSWILCYVKIIIIFIVLKFTLIESLYKKNNTIQQTLLNSLEQRI